MGIFTIRLQKETEKKLEEISKETKRPKSYFVKMALEEYLSDIALYQRALDRLNNPKDKIISADEMEKELS